MFGAVVYQHGYRHHTSGSGVPELVGSFELISKWLTEVIVSVDMDFDGAINIPVHHALPLNMYQRTYPC